jgi:hypothetical protein
MFFGSRSFNANLDGCLHVEEQPDIAGRIQVEEPGGEFVSAASKSKSRVESSFLRAVVGQ